MSAVTRQASTAKVTTPTDREIRIERVFDAPRDRVWRAFTDPQLKRRIQDDCPVHE